MSVYKVLFYKRKLKCYKRKSWPFIRPKNPFIRSKELSHYKVYNRILNCLIFSKTFGIIEAFSWFLTVKNVQNFRVFQKIFQNLWEMKNIIELFMKAFMEVWKVFNCCFWTFQNFWNYFWTSVLLKSSQEKEVQKIFQNFWKVRKNFTVPSMFIISKNFKEISVYSKLSKKMFFFILDLIFNIVFFTFFNFVKFVFFWLRTAKKMTRCNEIVIKLSSLTRGAKQNIGNNRAK